MNKKTYVFIILAIFGFSNIFPGPSNTNHVATTQQPTTLNCNYYYSNLMHKIGLPPIHKEELLVVAGNCAFGLAMLTFYIIRKNIGSDAH